jgi:ribonuclease P protein component
LAAVGCWRLGAGEGVNAFPLESSVKSAVPRLKRRSEFLRVARDGRSWTSPGLVLQVWRRDERDDMPKPSAIRVGFTASRKVGNAVARNRARRRLREVARRLLPAMAAPGRDYVLIGRRATIERPFLLLLADLETALRRLGAEKGRKRETAAAAKPEDVR